MNSQRSLTDQLTDAAALCDRHGLPLAADWIRAHIAERPDISAAMRELANRRTPEQRRGGRPRGWVMPQEVRDRISQAKRAQRSTEEKPKRPRGRPRKNTSDAK